MPHPRAAPDPLTRRQQEWLTALRDFHARHGRAPTRVELAVAAGCASGGSARLACDVLERKGYLVRVFTASGRRQYVPVERAEDA
jgi:SOS-response transcriptional repressor LexA